MNQRVMNMMKKINIIKNKIRIMALEIKKLKSLLLNLLNNNLHHHFLVKHQINLKNQILNNLKINLMIKIILMVLKKINNSVLLAKNDFKIQIN